MRTHLIGALGLLLAIASGCVERTAVPVAPATKSASAKLPETSTEKPTVTPDSGKTALKYPDTTKQDQVDDYHGTKVSDPYRWLENPDSPETKAWVEAENKVTFGYLESIPQREKLKERLTKLWDYEKFGVPSQRGGRYFYSHNDGLQNQNVLFKADGLNAEPTVLLDPNTLSKDGTVALAGYEISDDGKLMAYGLAAAGSDWQEWRVRDVATGKDLDDKIEWVKFSSASWSSDGGGFFYSRYDEPTEETKLTGTNYYQKLYYHKIGDAQANDKLVYERKDEKEWGFRGDVTDDGRYLIISVWRGTERKNQVFYRDLSQEDSKVVELIAGFEAQYAYLGNDGGLFWFNTDLDAPNHRIVTIDTANPAKENWKVLVKEEPDVIESASVVGNRLIIVYLHDAQSNVKLFDPAGLFQGEIELPGTGTAAGFTGRRSDKETFYSFTGFTTPPTIYRLDVTTGGSDVYRQPKVDFKPDDYETQQIFYQSKDGARVPMFILHKKGLKLDGARPTLLYGYGGFNIPLTPTFSVSRLVWLEMGGVYAVPSLRGGGEYGRAWHEAGMKEKKQNVFDDFIAAAEWLIKSGYTSPSKLAISGRSNGGLLVGACLTQRPELFGATLPGVGVMDMLRFHKFTIGWAWVSEYGSADNAEEFKTLQAYSPLHNIKRGLSYPATLITTADHDDRVVPAHSFKFAATLQAAQVGPAPILIRIETSAGHGAGTPTAKLIDEVADSYAFLIKALRIEAPDK